MGIKTLVNSFKNFGKGDDNHKKIMKAYLKVAENIGMDYLELHKSLIEYLRLYSKKIDCSEIMSNIKIEWITLTADVELYWFALSFS